MKSIKIDALPKESKSNIKKKININGRNIMQLTFFMKNDENCLYDLKHYVWNSLHVQHNNMNKIIKKTLH